MISNPFNESSTEKELKDTSESTFQSIKTKTKTKK